MSEAGAPFAFRLVALDLDGTVLRASGRVSSRTRWALHEVRRRGALISVATGRAPLAARQFAALLGADGPLICLDGALAFAAASPDAALLCDCPLDPRVAAAATEAARSLGGGWIALTRGGRVHGGPSRRPPQATWGRVLRQPLRAWRFYRTVRREPAERAESLPGEPVYKLLLWAPAGEAHQRLAARIRHLPVRVPSAPGSTIEVVAPGVHKGRALAAAVSHLGLDPAAVVAFGDGLNDVEMLAYAGRGVAMGGAPSAVRAAACAETESAERDGVARELWRLMCPDPSGRRRGKSLAPH
jgi:hydroxymethylpyrimidine pyrophosphatase-like HAD family hydrolase